MNVFFIGKWIKKKQNLLDLHVAFCFLSSWSSLGMQVKQEALLKGCSVHSPRGNHLGYTLFPPEGSVLRVSGATAPCRDRTLTQRTTNQKGFRLR